MVLKTRIALKSKKAGDIIDYTKFRAGGYIAICPKCDRKGKKRNWRGYKIEYIHKMGYLNWCYQLLFEDSCYTPGWLHKIQTP